MTARPQSGFTLLEVLIAVALLGMVILLLDQGIGFGLRAASMQDRATNRVAGLAAVDQALRQMIGSADPGIFPEPATLRGSADAVSMVTELPVPADGRHERVTARLYAASGQLRLRWTPRRHVERFGPAPPPQEMVLLSGIRALHLSYFPQGGSAWRSTWAAEVLPALVRIEIVFADPSRHWPPLVVAPVREALEQ